MVKLKLCDVCFQLYSKSRSQVKKPLPKEAVSDEVTIIAYNAYACQSDPCALIYVHNAASQDADMHVLYDVIKKSHAVVVHCRLHNVPTFKLNLILYIQTF